MDKPTWEFINTFAPWFSASIYGYIIEKFDNSGEHETNKHDTLSFGLYKITAQASQASWSFYLDLRDHVPNGGYVDLHLRFGDGNDHWAWRFGVGECEQSWHNITDDDTVTFWEIWEGCNAPWADSTADRSKFQPINPSNLAYTKVSGSPRLTWDGTPALYGTEKYDVYRGYQGGYNRIAQNLTVRYYWDDDVTFLPKNYLFQYKIKAISGDGNKTSDGYSNILTIMGDGPISKGIARGGVAVRPTGFEVNSFPNPFNPSATIEYSLPNESDVSITIFNMRGRTVYSTVNEAQQAGYYQVKWSGTDLEGNLVESGMYFLKIQTSEYKDVVKMIYLR